MTYSVSETVSTFHNTATSKVTGGSVAEWSACQTHNPAVPGSSRSRPGELLDLLLVVPSSNPWPHQLVNSQLIASYQLRFLIPLCYVVFELFVSKHLTGVPVNQLLDKLSALSTINQPLNLLNLYVTWVSKPLFPTPTP